MVHPARVRLRTCVPVCVNVFRRSRDVSASSGRVLSIVVESVQFCNGELSFVVLLAGGPSVCWFFILTHVFSPYLSVCVSLSPHLRASLQGLYYIQPNPGVPPHHTLCTSFTRGGGWNVMISMAIIPQATLSGYSVDTDNLLSGVEAMPAGEVDLWERVGYPFKHVFARVSHTQAYEVLTMYGYDTRPSVAPTAPSCRTEVVEGLSLYPHCVGTALAPGPRLIGWQLNVHGDGCAAGDADGGAGSWRCPGVPDGTVASRLRFRYPALYSGEHAVVLGPASANVDDAASVADCPDGMVQQNCSCDSALCDGVVPAVRTTRNLRDSCIVRRASSTMVDAPVRAVLHCVRLVETDVPMTFVEVSVDGSSGDSVQCPPRTTLWTCACYSSRGNCQNSGTASADYLNARCVVSPESGDVTITAKCMLRDYCSMLQPCGSYPCVPDDSVRGYHCECPGGPQWTAECREVTTCPMIAAPGVEPRARAPQADADGWYLAFDARNGTLGPASWVEAVTPLWPVVSLRAQRANGSMVTLPPHPDLAGQSLEDVFALPFRAAGTNYSASRAKPLSGNVLDDFTQRLYLQDDASIAPLGSCTCAAGRYRDMVDDHGMLGFGATGDG